MDIATNILTIKEPTAPLVSSQSPAAFSTERTHRLLQAADLSVASPNDKTQKSLPSSNTLVVNDVIPDLMTQMTPAERDKTTFICRNTGRLDVHAQLGGAKLLEHAAKRSYNRIVLANFTQPDRMMDELQFADGLLAPGGKIVLLAPEGLFDPKDSRSEGFFKWMEAHRTFEVTKLPKHRSFPDARLVIVEDPNTERLLRLSTSASAFFLTVGKSAVKMPLSTQTSRFVVPVN